MKTPKSMEEVVGHLSSHYKGTYTVKSNPNRQIHPIIQTLQQHPYAQILPLSIDHMLHNAWQNEIASIRNIA
jgi:hypothetical protein